MVRPFNVQPSARTRQLAKTDTNSLPRHSLQSEGQCGEGRPSAFSCTGPHPPEKAQSPGTRGRPPRGDAAGWAGGTLCSHICSTRLPVQDCREPGGGAAGKATPMESTRLTVHGLPGKLLVPSGTGGGRMLEHSGRADEAALEQNTHSNPVSLVVNRCHRVNTQAPGSRMSCT